MNFKSKRLIMFITVTILCFIIIGMVVLNSTINKPLKIVSDEEILIEEGESFYSLLKELRSKNKVKNTFVIKAYTKLTGMDLEIIPGQYTLNKNMSTKEMIELLQSVSDENYINFTIPEGFTIDDIAEKLEKEGICTSEDFIKAINEYPLPTYIKANSEKRYNLEGFLFPDTYKFEKGILPEEIVKTLLNRFDEVWNEIVTNLGIKVNNDDIEKVITVASMVEKEARVDEERATIASVIYNRDNKDMTLSIDATVLYAYGYHKDKLYYKDLEIESPYNTYLYKGLPIGPISNPGAPSIIAALKPENTDYLFYVLESDNKHYFTNNDEDFMKKQEELGY